MATIPRDWQRNDHYEKRTVSFRHSHLIVNRWYSSSCAAGITYIFLREKNNLKWYFSHQVFLTITFDWPHSIFTVYTKENKEQNTCRLSRAIHTRNRQCNDRQKSTPWSWCSPPFSPSCSRSHSLSYFTPFFHRHFYSNSIKPVCLPNEWRRERQCERVRSIQNVCLSHLTHELFGSICVH